MARLTKLAAYNRAIALHGTFGPYWDARRCFVQPPPILDTAANLLSRAADAVLVGDDGLARHLLQQAEMQELVDYAKGIMSATPHDVIRWRPARDLPPRAKVGPRDPSRAVETAIYIRDGWRCRFCGCRVVRPDARKRMMALLPGAITWRNAYGDHPALFVLNGCADHVVPHSLGGASTLENLVTTCAPCNYGRGDMLLEEVGLLDPRDRPPLPAGGWDGLERLLLHPTLASSQA